MCGSELHTLRSIKAVVPMPYHPFDSHSGAYTMRAEPGGISPFIGIDSFTMPQPFFGSHPHDDIPLVQVDGGSVRIVAGEFNGQFSPISHDARWLTKVNMLDITLQPGASVSLPVKAGDNAFFVIRSGTFSAPGQQNIAGAAIIFAADGAVAKVQAGEQTLRGVFFSGTPINEPMFSKGPFMGTTAQYVAQYAARCARGEMGQPAQSF
jgi:redox-sensitive bicupin YhaK (pirin superfamily)